MTCVSSQVLAGSAGKQAEPRRRDMLADLVSAAEDDSLKMLPFLRGAAAGDKDGREHRHTIGGGGGGGGGGGLTRRFRQPLTATGSH